MTKGDESLSEVEVAEPVMIEDASWQRKSTRPWLKPLLLGAGLGIAIAFLGGGLVSRLLAGKQNAAGDKSTQKPTPSLTVTVAPVETARVSLTLNTTGNIAARDLIPVLAQTNGLQIKSIPNNVKEGSFVNKGQVLAILDDSVLQTQISQAKADVESKQADVVSRQADVESKQASVAASLAIVQQRRADLAQAKARLEEAQKNFRRYKELASSGAISDQELDTRSYTVKTAIETVHVGEENVRSAQANVGSAKANIGNAQAVVNKAKADVRNSAAKVEQLQAQLAQTVVRAPASGIIAEKLARVGDVTGVAPQTQIGNVIGGSQKLFSIIQNGQLELQAEVTNLDLTQVKVGGLVQITADADQRVDLQGRVREIEPLVNDKNRQAIVKIDLPSTNLLKPGMFARAEITTGRTMGMTVPQKAVLSQADESVIVFTQSGEDLDPDPRVEVREVRAQKVEVGESINGDRVAIKSGLELSDRVVVDGAGYVKDGDRVRVVNQ
ncbi:efflux RND transporter periplasmic adaptor subunit [Cylindrospermum sp. FACHB-282]|uniref:efflux RND transporter periplasmic adaptor subunit n=1 Tax=Cylindrospermum sp. FACHB-282 TaxID=2692794 RepID=UPI0016854A10|nr:efflux RND transporter periplasmic adaptor subunit [Cylindrospermum sp. FACHB-282]MBD2387804.1 efflux RND transporter periplasmic adaptor subunit [Cylindrospermum sp. FACHB-282]